MGRKAESERGFIAIRPEDIVLSAEALHSSMRNCFRARILNAVDRGFFYEVSVVEEQGAWRGGVLSPGRHPPGGDHPGL